MSEVKNIRALALAAFVLSLCVAAFLGYGFVRLRQLAEVVVDSQDHIARLNRQIRQLKTEPVRSTR